jgi:hypothetical protein
LFLLPSCDYRSHITEFNGIVRPLRSEIYTPFSTTIEGITTTMALLLHDVTMKMGLASSRAASLPKSFVESWKCAGGRSEKAFLYVRKNDACYYYLYCSAQEAFL